MAKYCKKPIVVEAIQFTDETRDQVFNNLTGNITTDFEDGKPILKVKTIRGEIAIVRLGDWIIKENKQGYYCPCKPDVFKKTYEKVEEK